MGEPNDRLRRARERVESPNATGEPLSRQELAELVNAWVYDNTNPRRVIATDANYVGQLERGRIRWPQDPDRRAGFRAVLGAATDAQLGFRRPRRSRSTVADVDRQQFIRTTLGATAATVGGGPFAFADLIGLIQPTPVPSVVGYAEVAEVRNVARAFAGWDNRYGSGLLREAVVAQLRYCAELLNARCSERVRADLFSAVGDLAHVTGFMAFDACAHDDARRMFRFALHCAEESGDWHLRAFVLSITARQATWCGDPDAGLTLIELAMVRADRLTATERAILHNSRARALAKLGRIQDAAAAVGLADEEFSHARPANDPAHVRDYDAVAHAEATGRTLWDIAVHGHFVAEARDRLSTAATGYREERARGRVMSQIKLASLVMVTGDPDEAAVIGGQALDAASTIRSQRAADDMRELRRFSEPHQRLTAVAELTQRIGSAVVLS
ncbi:MAG: XRE family transcriptional regulator [Actinomycetota bacterium]|nr:XRE family transcriptional regulator [Actinomycetota bacterium]